MVNTTWRERYTGARVEHCSYKCHASRNGCWVCPVYLDNENSTDWGSRSVMLRIAVRLAPLQVHDNVNEYTIIMHVPRNHRPEPSGRRSYQCGANIICVILTMMTTKGTAGEPRYRQEDRNEPQRHHHLIIAKLTAICTVAVDCRMAIRIEPSNHHRLSENMALKPHPCFEQGSFFEGIFGGRCSDRERRGGIWQNQRSQASASSQIKTEAEVRENRRKIHYLKGQLR